MNAALYHKRLRQVITDLGGIEAAEVVTGVSRRTLKNYYYGRNFPTAVNLQPILLNSGVSADWLFGMTEGPKWLIKHE